MKTYLRLVFILILLFFSGKVFSQYTENTKPVLWLQGFSEFASDSVNRQLNFNHFPLKLNKTEASTRDFSRGNHLFIVYKTEAEEPLVSIMGQKNGVFVGSDKVFRKENISMKGYNQPYGELVDVRVSNIEKGKLWVHPTKDTEVYEVMVFNSYLNPLKVNEVRTYLAIKYGLDLSDTEQYVYDNEKLWEKTGEYRNNIFGIGYFSAYNLLQKKSIHSKDEDLVVSYASRRSNKVKRGDYVLLANNGEKFHFDTRSHYNEKEWFCRTNMDEAIIDLYIPQEKTTSTELNRFWVEIHFEGQKRSYIGVAEKEYIVFRNIRINKGDYIVKLKGEKTKGRFDYQTTCEYTYLTFSSEYKDNFDLRILDDQGHSIMTMQQYKEKITLDNNETTYFDVHLQSAEGNVVRRIQTLGKELEYDELREGYTLNESGVLTIQIPEEEKEEVVQIIRKWKKDGNQIAEGNAVQITEPGVYTLTSIMGDCVVNQSFTVTRPTDFQRWTVYPNPATDSDLLTVRFDLEKEQNVKVDVYHIDGKKIKSLSFDHVSTDTFEIGQLPNGQYIVVAYIDALPQIKKIIVQQTH